MRKLEKKLKEYSIFIWLILLILITLLSQDYYNKNRQKQFSTFKKSLSNIYLHKTLKKITSNLKSRYKSVNYIVKSGDTYESIIKNIKIENNEQKIFLDNIKKNQSLKILKTGQKIFFKIDRLKGSILIEFKIETNKKNEMLFSRIENTNTFKSKLIEKNFTKKVVYKETIITSSLYSSAEKLDIKPNIILEFARLYGFQVDFQRDVWKNDNFQIIYEEFIDSSGKIIDTGDIIFANLKLQNNDLQLYRYEYKKNKVDYFDENGKSVRKTLMKTPINGARLSSSFGKRKHPILGYNKMHLGTDFAAPKGTPIMASGDGVITRAQWCGGGGNCVKIKHNSMYQTVYAHLSKFGNGIKKGVRVKQGQIIGYVGSTGLSTGPHLHYEVIRNGKKINSQKLKLPSGIILKGQERKNFEVSKIKIDVLKSEIISQLN
tara:strand:- start:3473 stop:4768 length:1296 start_codon:yes stop_codon:yes gene_type:complete